MSIPTRNCAHPCLPARPSAAPLGLMLLFIMSLTGCASTGKVDRDPIAVGDNGAKLTPVSKTHRDLVNLPAPAGKITASIYGFRDQTGQYKPAPNSSFSTSVTQGAASILVKAILDSAWFVPLEREGLNDLLTERKIIRAANEQRGYQEALTPLSSAKVLLEGGIVAYETNVQTGGAGARYLGIGGSDLYRMDQVTVNLRAVDIRTGVVLNSVSTTKTIYSVQLDFGVFKFVSYKELLEIEAGYSRNEPAQLCVTEAIESAVIHLIAQGIRTDTWRLSNGSDIDSATLRPYLDNLENQSAYFDPEIISIDALSRSD